MSTLKGNFIKLVIGLCAVVAVLVVLSLSLASSYDANTPKSTAPAFYHLK